MVVCFISFAYSGEYGWKGRWADNIMIERFWRTLKYEEVYLKAYDTLPEAREEIAAYIRWYKHHRRHSSLKKQKPYEVMTGSINPNYGLNFS